MISTVLFDIGGTLHTVRNDETLRLAFAKRLSERLEVYGIALNMPYDIVAERLHKNAEEYKHWSESSKRELPSVKIWNDYYLKEYSIGEDRLAPIAEELSFLYDYERVSNLRRPYLNETIDELAQMGIKMGIISNIISTSFVPHILQEYGIAHHMKTVILSSVAGVRKPSAAIFELALKEVNASAEETAYVGDTISRDVLGARNAGLGLVIQIENKAIAHRDAAFSGPDAPKPDFLIKQLNEIPNIVRRVNKR